MEVEKRLACSRRSVNGGLCYDSSYVLPEETSSHR